jgi:hypothetical protein
MFSSLLKAFNRTVYIFLQKLMEEKEVLQATVDWRGGKQKQVRVVAGTSCSVMWPAAGAATPSGCRQQPEQVTASRSSEELTLPSSITSSGFGSPSNICT